MDMEICTPEGEIVLFARNIGDVKIIFKLLIEWFKVPIAPSD